MTHAYNTANQLAKLVNEITGQNVFTYDGRGRLRQRVDYQWAGTPYNQWFLGPTVRYIYDGMRVIQERDGSNVPTVSYTRGTDLSGSLEGAGGIGGLLSRSAGYSSGTGNWSAHHSYHADGNGNVTYLVNSIQKLGASYRYDPFGNTISSSGGLASANTYRFSSKEFHTDSGFYYYGYRFYAPATKRWVNRDPLTNLGFKALTRRFGFVDKGNLYGFVSNDAADRIDMLGLEDATTSNAGVRCCGGDPADARVAMQAGLDAANASYPGAGTVENRAMRHCVASGVLSTRSGCGPAACIGTLREDFQNSGVRTRARGNEGRTTTRLEGNVAGAKVQADQTTPGRGRPFTHILE